MNPHLKIWHLLGLFALALLPFAATLALYYTAGAMQMLREYAWLAPKMPENCNVKWLPRFQKPPLTYWNTAIEASPQAQSGFVAKRLLPWTE